MKRVLVVDDFAGVRLFHASLLKGAGFSTEMAGSGEEALRMLEQGAFDLMVLDLIMPGMGGLEVLKRIRTQHSLEKLPVIVITSEAEAVTHDDLITVPLVKPVLPAQLLSVAKEFLSERNAHGSS